MNGKVNEPLSNEDNEEPSSPQAKDPSRYVQNYHLDDQIVYAWRYLLFTSFPYWTNFQRDFYFPWTVSQGSIDEIWHGVFLVNTPMVTSCKLNKIHESPEVDQTLYMSIIGNLLYLTTIRLDIMKMVGIVGRFQVMGPRESHLLQAKRTLRYLTATMDYALW